MKKRVILLAVFLGSCAQASPVPDSDGIYARISPEVTKLRELEFKQPVPVGKKTKEEIQKYIERRISEEYAPEEMELEKKVLSLLGLIPSDFPYEKYIVSLLREQVAGYYDPLDKAFYLADWVSAAESEPVIAHELTHALQDQHFLLLRLMKRIPENDDRTAAINALVEGDGLSVMMDFGIRESGKRMVDLPDMRETLRAQLRAQREAEMKKDPTIPEPPAYFLETLLFPYVEGFGFIQSLRLNGGWKKVDGAFTNLPVSTEQILHPEKFLADEKPISIERSVVKKFLPRGLNTIQTNVMGEFGWRTVFREKLGVEQALKSSEGWGGDRYWLLQDDQKKTNSLVMLTTWDTQEDAQEFRTAWEKLPKKAPAISFSRGQKVLIALNLGAKEAEKIAQGWFK